MSDQKVIDAAVRELGPKMVASRVLEILPRRNTPPVDPQREPVAPEPALVETVARAWCELDWPHIDWPNLKEYDQAQYLRRARAIIAALRSAGALVQPKEKTDER